MQLSRREILAAALPPALGGFAQRELDVPFVATPHELVRHMLDMAEVGPGDYLIDLGCGDGRIAVAAALRGARALGVDLNPLRIQEAHAAARIAGVETRALFRREDLFRTPIFEANVVALYLLPDVNLRLRPRLLTELRPGSRVVSHAFDMGDWRPDEESELDGRRAFLWIIPAIAGGSWAVTVADGTAMALEIEQRFQEVAGTLTGPGRTMQLQAPVLRGTELSFAIETAEGSREWRGRIGDADMTGIDSGWTARRIA